MIVLLLTLLVLLHRVTGWLYRRRSHLYPKTKQQPASGVDVPQCGGDQRLFPPCSRRFGPLTAYMTRGLAQNFYCIVLKSIAVDSIVLRAQIISEIKSFTAMLQKGAELPDLYAARDRIKRLMHQLEVIESQLDRMDRRFKN